MNGYEIQELFRNIEENLTRAEQITDQIDDYLAEKAQQAA